jgi:hypothetical protein
LKEDIGSDDNEYDRYRRKNSRARWQAEHDVKRKYLKQNVVQRDHIGDQMTGIKMDEKWIDLVGISSSQKPAKPENPAEDLRPVVLKCIDVGWDFNESFQESGLFRAFQESGLPRQTKARFKSHSSFGISCVNSSGGYSTSTVSEKSDWWTAKSVLRRHKCCKSMTSLCGDRISQWKIPIA